MFGVFKKIFNRSAGRPVPPSATVATAAPAAAVSQKEARADTTFTPASPGSDSVSVSFVSIVKLVPKELIGKNTPSVAATFSMPLRRVISQLAQGAVRVPFKELRRSAPSGTFISYNTHDDKLIDLPLREILPQVHQQSFTRRQQVRLDAPDDGTELFNRAGEPAAPLRVLQKDELLLEPEQKALTVKTGESKKLAFTQGSGGSGGVATSKATVVEPIWKRTTTPAPQRLEKPAAPAGGRSSRDTLAVPLNELVAKWPENVKAEIESWELHDAQCLLPADKVGPALKTGAVRFVWKDLRSWIRPAAPDTDDPVDAELALDLPLNVIAPLYLANCRAPVEQKKAVDLDQIPDVFSRHGAVEQEAADSDEVEEASESADTKTFLSVSLSLVSQKWPEALRKEITLLRLNEAKVELPIETIEAALKTGKFECHWKQICHWLKPCPTSALASVHADMRLDMPLNLLAPLYLKQRSAIEGTEDANRTTVTPAAARSAASPSETEAEVAPARNLAELFGEPDKRNWTPNEIVHKTSALRGVAGALMALQDGLLVASCMPPEWKSETVAAFLPQIFGRMKQYSKELKMGELESISFSVEHGTFQIYNVGIIYFAILARPSSTLPKESLKLIVRELARHTR